MASMFLAIDHEQGMLTNAWPEKRISFTGDETIVGQEHLPHVIRTMDEEGIDEAEWSRAILGSDQAKSDDVSIARGILQQLPLRVQQQPRQRVD
jgi:hypothetical protein